MGQPGFLKYHIARVALIRPKYASSAIRYYGECQSQDQSVSQGHWVKLVPFREVFKVGGGIFELISLKKQLKLAYIFVRSLVRILSFVRDVIISIGGESNKRRL